MSDFSDIYGGGAGALLLPGSFGGFRTGWAYPVPPAPDAQPPGVSGLPVGNLGTGSRYADRLWDNEVVFTPFLVPPGINATTARIWLTTSPDWVQGNEGSTPTAGNNARVAVYAVGSGSTLTRVGSDVEISVAGANGPKTGALVAAVSGGATGAVYYIACNKTGPSFVYVHSAFRSFTSNNVDSLVSTIVSNPVFAAFNSMTGVPYTGSTLPGASAIPANAPQVGWALRGDRTYGAFPSSLDLFTDVTNLRHTRSVPQFLVGF